MRGNNTVISSLILSANFSCTTRPCYSQLMLDRGPGIGHAAQSRRAAPEISIEHEESILQALTAEFGGMGGREGKRKRWGMALTWATVKVEKPISTRMMGGMIVCSNGNTQLRL